MAKEKCSIKGFRVFSGRINAVFASGKMQNKGGFTLLEVLVVVLIIGILTSIALPQYQKAVEKSRATAAMAYAEAWVAGQELYYMANGVFAQGRAIGDKRLPSDKFDISLPDELKDFIVYDETPENASGTELRLYRKAENDPGRWDLVSPYRLEVIISIYDDGKFTIYRRCSSNRINPFCKAISNGVNCANAPEAPWCRW